MGNKVLAILFCLLVWPILLPAGIDTGIGNAFWTKKYSILYSNTFSNITNWDAARLSNSICTWIKPGHQDQTQVTAATPPSKDFFAHITSNRNATIARPDAVTQMLRWNHIFQILPPNCPWKPIRISAKFTWSWTLSYQQCSSRTSVLHRLRSLLSSSLPFVRWTFWDDAVFAYSCKMVKLLL